MIQHNRQQLLAIWMIWSSILMAVVTVQFAFGRGIPTGSNAPAESLNPFVLVSVMQILVASAIRWLLVPRVDAPGKILVLMIVGLAFSESVEMFGLFLVPADQPSMKLTLWLLSLASVIQFVPVYARNTPQPDTFRTG